MSLPVPLAVRLTTSAGAKTITREVRDLSISGGIPGGFGAATLPLDRPLTTTEIAAFDRVYVTDSRHGGLVYSGRLEDPGRSAGPDGQVWTLVASGGGSHASDNTTPVVYVDQIDFGMLQRAGSSKRAGDAGEDVDSATGEPAYRIGLPNGFTAATNDEVSVLYQALRETGQTLARESHSGDMGRTSNDWRLRLKTYPSGTVARDDAFNTAGVAASARRATLDFPAADNYLKFMIQYTGGGGQIAVDTTWAVIKDPYVIGSRVDIFGVALDDTLYNKATVNDEDVIRDQIGRNCPLFDAANARIAAGSFEMDQCAYIDGANPAKVFEDMMRLVRRYWAVWGINPTTGLYDFEWSVFPSGVRFGASTRYDLFESPGSMLDLYDRVKVRYLDRKGRVRFVTRTQTVPALAAAGLSRTAPTINLADELGSVANANQAGDAFLAEHAYPPNAGTLTINRPIFDSVLGRNLWPWELVRHAPAQLIRVADVAPRPDGLNLTERDGATVFRVMNVTYSPGTGAVLSLDSAPRRLTTLIAQARREFSRARKR